MQWPKTTSPFTFELICDESVASLGRKSQIRFVKFAVLAESWIHHCEVSWTSDAKIRENELFYNIWNRSLSKKHWNSQIEFSTRTIFLQKIRRFRSNTWQLPDSMELTRFVLKLQSPGWSQSIPLDKAHLLMASVIQISVTKWVKMQKNYSKTWFYSVFVTFYSNIWVEIKFFCIEINVY